MFYHDEGQLLLHQLSSSSMAIFGAHKTMDSEGCEFKTPLRFFFTLQALMKIHRVIQKVRFFKSKVNGEILLYFPHTLDSGQAQFSTINLRTF